MQKRFFMRYQGKITSWKDEQGFGFITPNGGGDRVFVHVKAFLDSRQRPGGNELVTYELTRDEKNRIQAKHVEFVKSRIRAAPSSRKSGWSLFLPAIFLVFLAGLTFRGKLPLVILLLYFFSSAIAYIAYALDKAAARRGNWRTEESTLHLLALIGGWPGALIAQQRLRHKSQKTSFQVVFWVTVTLNCGALAWFLTVRFSSGLSSIPTIY